MNVSLCVLFSTLIAFTSCELLTLKNGVINGTVGKSRNGRPFQQFYSIPYAEPPVRELRFKAPVAIKPWPDVKDVSKLPPRCIQPSTFITLGSSKIIQEDCLYLSVFVPNNLFKPSGKAPVIVYIHGGSFEIGSAAGYNPEYFMDKDVILVMMNYRLGVLGFFGLNNDAISGNFGLKDQVLALQWVKENIADFGGDPHRVTLMGLSAGSASVHLHMFSPLSKGLFQRAIMLSGSAYSDLAVLDQGFGEAISTSFLVISGCFRNDSIQVLKCLQQLPVDDFLTLGNRLYLRNFTASRIIFKPITESNVKNTPFLPKRPVESTYQTDVPWITGITSGEGAMPLTKHLVKGGVLEKVENVDRNSLAPLLWPYLHSLDPENIENNTQKIIDFYFNSTDTGSNNMLKLVNIFTDIQFFYPLVKTVQSKTDKQYVYYYDYRGSFSWQDHAKLNIDLGVGHADELPLIFRNKNLESKWTPQDKLVSDNLIKFWTEFAITGDPDGESEEKTWKPTSSTGEIEYLHIRSNGTTMKKNLLKERYEFWESLLKTRNRK